MPAPTRPAKVRQRGRMGVILLTVVAALAMLGASVQFVRLLNADRDLDEIIREDAMWAIFQADRHMREVDDIANLIAVTGQTDRHADFLHQYDILYSRVMLLDRGAFTLDIASESSLVDRTADLIAFVRELEPEVDALDPSSAPYLDQMRDLSARLALVPAKTNRLVLDANAAMNKLRVESRKLRGDLQQQLGQILLILILAFVGIFGLLMLQMRSLSAAGRKMAVLQERSRRRAIRAQAANDAKTAFLATMSHEMRTPLNGIIGNAELIALGKADAATDTRLETIIASGILLRDLIDGVLDFSRMAKGQLSVTPTPVLLSDFGHALALSYGESAARAGLTLHIDMPDDVVMLDEALFRQLLAKLLDNALKFSADGQVRVNVSMLQPDLLRCTVTDQGIGIAPDDQALLFRGFNQIDGSHARSFGGTGLGLAICKRIVDAMGGRIGVNSTLGEGSCFWAELPIILADLPDDDAPQISPALTTAAQVLIVEDNPINADVLAAHLQDLGHSCRIVTNGQQAVDFLRETHVDLVMMDVQMPVMDGLAATRAIRASGLDVPILGVTANAFAQDRAECLAAGMTDFLPKPVTRKALGAILTRLGFAIAAPVDPPKPKPKADAPALSSQFRDLVDMLGMENAAQFLERFEGEIATFNTDMKAAITAQDQTRQDNLLHTFKGAALTLGLQVSGEQAQDLRGHLPITDSQLQELVTQAWRDTAQCRAGLKDLFANAS